ncbi:hypothetical protein ABZY45_31810 [Streptomyces sp. NPDC006516]|uniref:hypothetical protein n=1 Tax=Streptomyces sp. NPDC006516 TaxID=3154309 RepID=UPI00339E187B
MRGTGAPLTLVRTADGSFDGINGRIDRQVPGAGGTVRTYSPYDRTPGNDTAVIPVDTSPAALWRALSGPVARTAIAAAVAVAVVHRSRRRRRSG